MRAISKRLRRSSQSLNRGMGNYGPVLIFGGVAFLAYKLFSGLGKALGKVGELGDLNDEKGDAKKSADAKRIVSNIPDPIVSKMSFTHAQARSLSSQLFKAMHGSAFLSPMVDGTDEKAIYDAFSHIINADDMRAVYKAFGVVRYYASSILGNTDLDLIGWLRAELSDEEFSLIQSKINLL